MFKINYFGVDVHGTTKTISCHLVTTKNSLMRSDLLIPKRIKMPFFIKSHFFRINHRMFVYEVM